MAPRPDATKPITPPLPHLGDASMADPESTADRPAFSTEFQERLATGKYTKWAVDLTEDQLNVVLWAAGEFGRRGLELPSCIDPHTGRFDPSDARARVGLELLAATVHGHPLSKDEYFPAFWARVRQLADQHHTKQNPNPETDESNDLLRGIVAGSDAVGGRGPRKARCGQGAHRARMGLRDCNSHRWRLLHRPNGARGGSPRPRHRDQALRLVRCDLLPACAESPCFVARSALLHSPKSSATASRKTLTRQSANLSPLVTFAYDSEAFLIFSLYSASLPLPLYPRANFT